MTEKRYAFIEKPYHTLKIDIYLIKQRIAGNEGTSPLVRNLSPKSLLQPLLRMVVPLYSTGLLKP